MRCRAAPLHEGEMQLRRALVADAQPAEVTKLGEGALDAPALTPQARAVLRAAAKDDRLHPRRSECSAVDVKSEP